MAYEKIKITTIRIIFAILIFWTTSTIAYANYQISWQGTVVYSNNSNVPSGNWTISLNDTVTGNVIFNQTFANSILTFPNGLSGIHQTFYIDQLVYNRNYTACFYISTPNIPMELTKCTSWQPSAGRIEGAGMFYNTTVTTYNGNLNGYTAGNTICANTYNNTHFCSYHEIMNTISNKNLTQIPGWTGEAWISTGPAKYSPALLPDNDCNGWTWGTSGSYLGNWWHFNQTTGGDGRAGHCGNLLPLACCE